MKKKFELFLAAAQVPVDFVMISLSAFAAYYLRYQDFVTEIRPVVFDLPFQQFTLIVFIASIFWIVIFAWFKLYTTRRITFTEETSRIVQACSISIMAITTYMVFIREIFSSRFIIIFTWVFSIIFVILGRIFLRLLRNYFRRKGFGVYKTLIIGKNSITSVLTDLYKNKPQLGINVYKVINPSSDLITQLKKQKNLDEIIQTDSNISRSVSAKIIDHCHSNHIIYKYVGGNFESKVTNNEVHTIAGIPLIELKRTPLDGWGKILKRNVDIVGSIFAIIIFSPFMLLTAIAVKLTSEGPIYADTPPRAGKYGKPFRMYKFRSMYVGAHKDQKKYKSDRPGLFKMANDPRLTKIGKFIRKTSLDELPQFFNVLRGNMSLVGPRPHFLNEYTKEQLKVLDIKPGITGSAQISGRSDLEFSEELKLDSYYIENWSIWLDFWILFKTPIILFTKIKSAV